MYKYKFIICISLFTLLLSCERNKNYSIVEVDNISVYLNKNKANNKKLLIETKEIFRINGNSINETVFFNNPVSLDIDSENNIYILDSKLSTVLQFDKNGQYIKKMGTLGTGPGETRYPVSMFCQNDTISVLNQSIKQIVKFDISGKFIENQSTKECQMPVYLTKINNKKLIAYLCNWRKENDGYYMDYDLALITNNYEIKKYFKKQTISQKNVEIEDYDHPFAVSSNAVFFSEYDRNQYQIDAYDLNGNKKYSIKKAFKKIKFTNEELDNLYGNKIPENAYRYKSSINKLYFDDSSNRLWVAVTINRNVKNKEDFIVDIFKNGIFENRVTLDIEGNSEIRYSQILYLKDDRLYCLNSDTAEIIVYKFSYNL